MAGKAQRKAQVAEIVADVAKTLAANIDAEGVDDDVKSSRLAKLDNSGKMLMCEFTLAKRPGQPDPLCITVNEEIKWVKRGAKVVLPWYFVEHMLHNVERKYRQEKDPITGQPRVAFDDMSTEQFQYRAIDPAPNTEIQGPNEAPTQQAY
jgi:hypothetical protein